MTIFTEQDTLTEDATNKAKRKDISELARSMTRELDYYQSQDEFLEKGLNPCVIYRVQQHIRDVSRFSYEPLVLSIGPYHHGAAAVQCLEKYKWGYLDEVLKLNCKKNLLDHRTEIGGLAREARMCYSEDVQMDSENFLQMLLLDACFIFVALGGSNVFMACQQQGNTGPSDVEQILVDNPNESSSIYPGDNNNEATRTEQNTTNHGQNQTGEIEDMEDAQSQTGEGQWSIVFINHDLLLLENQIPFFVVQRLYDIVCGGNSDPEPLAEEIAKFIGTALRFYPIATRESGRPKKFHHLLHLCHTYFRPSQNVQEDHHYLAGPQYLNKFLSFGRRYLKLGHHLEENDHQQEVNHMENGLQLNRWRRAEQYIEAGVHFMKREFNCLNPHSLLDVKFSNGVLVIPCLFVDEYTEFLFRNLIAFEQTCPQFGDDFTAYIVFISQVVSMPEDVTLLAKKEIIVHHLDSDAKVADLLTMLSEDVVFDFNGNYYLKTLCQNLEECYQSNLNRWIAWLWRNHFSNPWLALAALATGLVLICTVVQTIFGILAYVNPAPA